MFDQRGPGQSDDQQAQIRADAHEMQDRFERRSIGPVDVLQQHDRHGLLREGGEELLQIKQGALAQLLRIMFARPATADYR